MIKLTNLLYSQQPAVVTHEILHALGVMHEHKRPDRDDFVVIEWNNIRGSAAPQFYRDIDGETGVRKREPHCWEFEFSA